MAGWRAAGPSQCRLGTAICAVVCSVSVPVPSGRLVGDCVEQGQQVAGAADQGVDHRWISGQRQVASADRLRIFAPDFCVA